MRVLSGLIVVFALACTVKPDEKSGGDEERHKAKQLKIGESQADSVSYKDGDRTDWRVLETPDAGFLTVTVRLDNPKNEIVVALFDRYGKPVTKMVHSRKDESPIINLTTEVEPGRYFIMVQAAHSEDRTGYAIQATLK